MRLLQSILSSDPTRMGMLAPWANHPTTARVLEAGYETGTSLSDVPMQALRAALGIGAEAAGQAKSVVAGFVALATLHCGSDPDAMKLISGLKATTTEKTLRVEEEPTDVTFGNLGRLVEELPALVVDPGPAHTRSL